MIISCNKNNGAAENNNESLIELKEPVDSELTLMMREMFDEVQHIRQQLADGDSVEVVLNHSLILEANSTDPGVATSAEYQAFARYYLQTLENLNISNPSQLNSNYEIMVNSCIVCHKSVCPGPITRIETLKIVMQ